MSNIRKTCHYNVLIAFIFIYIGLFPYKTVNAQSLVFAFGSSETPPRKWQEDGKYMGIYIDVVEEIMARSNIDIQMKPYPYKRLLRSLQSGEIDGAVGLFKTKDREQFSTYIDIPIAYTSINIFVKKDKLFNYNQINDLLNKEVGKARGVFISEEFQLARQHKVFSVNEIATYKQLIGKLLLGRIDAFVAPSLSTQFLLKEMGFSHKIVMLPHSIAQQQPLYILFSKLASTSEKQDLYDQVRQALTDMQRENRLKRITEKYGIIE